MNPSSEILLVLVLVLANGLFAMPRSHHFLPKARLDQQARGGSRVSQHGSELSTTPNRFLSNVKVGITLIGHPHGAVGVRACRCTCAGAGPDHWLALMPRRLLWRWWCVITYLSLVFGE
jgi:CBS domain containing-hemolysin-like protein